MTFHSVAGMALNGFKQEHEAILLVKIDFMANTNQKQTSIQSLNDHLNPKIGSTKVKPLIPYPQSITNETQSSVIFEEISTLILTKALYKLISYVNFQPHIKTFEDTGRLLTDTRLKIMSHLQPNGYPLNYRGLEEELLKLQNNKYAGIQVQLQDILYETNLIAQNFELMAERFTQITGYQISLQNNNSTKVHDNTSRQKHSLVLKIFKFIFGGDDGNSEVIEVLKKNVERLFQNDQLQEKQLQELLKSQKLNTDEVQINRNLLKRLTQDLAQINAMLSDLSFGVSIIHHDKFPGVTKPVKA